jgi:peptide/nickel transport system substrate-binding protein
LEFNQAPVGLGPFQLAPGGITPDGVTLITNPLYKGKKPYLDKIWFRFYPSSNAALSAMQANQVDGVSEVTANEAARLDTLKNIHEITTPRSRNTFLFLNLQRTALFGQKEVRQALAYAIDKPALVANALHGQAVVSSSPILATSWAYKKDINPYSFDLKKANKLLDDAGWKINRDGIREKDNQTLVFRMLIDDTADKRAVASQIAENLKAIQVVAQIETAPSPADLDASLRSSNYDATLLTVESVLNDPDPYGNWHSSFAEAGDQHTNFANWKLDRADQLLEQARAVVKQDERAKLYLQWQELWAEELPSIPLYYPT